MLTSLSNKTILIVDDTPENIDVLSEILSDYKRKIATNGERALKIVHSDSPPDIILLDIMMPGMDGYEVCKILKSDVKTKNIPIIFITAKSDIEDEMKGFSLGAIDFITKPISPPIVKARVKNHLELKCSSELVEKQNLKLANQNKHIMDSINYARRIQDAILPTQNTINKIFPECFIIYLPKDVVSGDFYWIYQLDHKKIVVVGDCTGHGVPGALMSMIGNTLLNEIVKVKEHIDPATILELLDKAIVDELKKDISTSTFDSIDVAICLVDESKNQIYFAGANRNLLLVNKAGLTELKGVNKSIGDNSKNTKYNSSEITIEKDTIIYLTTDGYVDQNNSLGIKFSTKRFKEVLKELYHYPMQKQKDTLMSLFEVHKGDQVQRDDITILGIKLNCNRN